ncbi:MAG: hypothetical protein ACRETR_12435 [Steroidobacteraceae bacterium]
MCPGYDPRDLIAFNESRECERKAIASAVHQIGSERLAAVHMRAVAAKG